MKISLRNNRYYSLLSIIVDDLLRYDKLPIFLFICIIITAISIVVSTHYTRLLFTKREQLLLERQELNLEWRNLILEENSLCKRDHTKHNMQNFSNKNINLN